MEADGYSLDDKRTFIDGKGDIPDIIEKFNKKNEEDLEDRKASALWFHWMRLKRMITVSASPTTRKSSMKRLNMNLQE